MAFGNISTLYLPVPASAGASQWGTDVRKLLASPDAGVDGSTSTNHGTGGSVVRTVDPYNDSATDATEANFGWAVTPSDMGSVSGARRFYPAGNHVATMRLNNSQGSGDITVTMFVYRVGPSPTRTRTLLGSASATVALPGLGAVTTGTVTVALGQIIFEADETIQYSWEITAPGVAVFGRQIFFRTGTDAGVAIRVDTPTLGTFYAKTLTAVMDGTPTLVRKATKTLVAVMDGSPTLVAAITGFKTLSAVMDGTPTLVRKVGKPLSAVMDGTASMSRKMNKILSAVMDGTPSMNKKSAKTLTVVMDGTPTVLRLTTVGRTLSVVMDGSPVLTRAVTVARTLSAVMNGLPFGFVKFPWGSIPDGDCPSDWSPNDGLKSIAGDVFYHEPPNEGDPVVGATVTLIRDSDGLLITTTTTDAAGHYSFPRDTNDPNTYHVEVRHSNQQGLSEGGCIPS